MQDSRIDPLTPTLSPERGERERGHRARSHVLRLRFGPKITAKLLWMTALIPLAIRLGAIINRQDFHQAVLLSEVPLLIMGLIAAVAYQA
jgi:hypothetical protein